MSAIHQILVATAFFAAVAGIIKPTWPFVPVAVLLLAVAMFIR